MFEILRAAIAAAPAHKLPELHACVWQRFNAGVIDEAQAEQLTAMRATPGVRLEAAPGHAPSARRAPRRPDPSASLARRRRACAAGWLPLPLAGLFSEAERAALSIVAQEVAKRGDCRLAIGHIAAIAGVGRTTVQNALRHARQLGLVSIEERRQSRFRSETNIVRITAPLWSSWLKLRARPPGFKALNGTSTQELERGTSARLRPVQAIEERDRRPARAPGNRRA